MSRTLSAALADRALVFEPVPPTIRANPVRSGLQLEELVRLLRGIDRLDAIDIPELVDENHEGRPYYRTGDIRGFARTLADLSGRAVVVNKVVAHLPSIRELENWVDETLAKGLSNVVLVGGSSRYIPYPGPPVIEANRICQPKLAPAGGRVGNIAIPQRVGEAHRMLAKTRAGAAFFTTQILFDATSAIRMIREYDHELRTVAAAPASVLLSFAPIADEADAEFVRWLGADLPDDAEEQILNAGDDLPPAARSVKRALEVYRAVDRARTEEGWTVPLGVNVEQVSQRHLASAVEMLRAFAARIDG